jgi:hypothetical protein
MAETGAILRGGEEIARNIRAVAKAVEAGLFAAAVEGACRIIVNEVRDPGRPLAWNDVTGNLRASISFQVEGAVGPKAVFGHNADGQPTTFNSAQYDSGNKHSVWGVVFAPPDYAIEVEARSTRSVLLAPLNTVRGKLRAEMHSEGGKAWDKFVIARRALGSVT